MAYHTQYSSLLDLDACIDVPHEPQSGIETDEAQHQEEGERHDGHVTEEE